MSQESKKTPEPKKPPQELKFFKTETSPIQNFAVEIALVGSHYPFWQPMCKAIGSADISILFSTTTNMVNQLTELQLAETSGEGSSILSEEGVQFFRGGNTLLGLSIGRLKEESNLHKEVDYLAVRSIFRILLKGNASISREDTDEPLISSALIEQIPYNLQLYTKTEQIPLSYFITDMGLMNNPKELFYVKVACDPLYDALSTQNYLAIKLLIQRIPGLGEEPWQLIKSIDCYPEFEEDIQKYYETQVRLRAHKNALNALNSVIQAGLTKVLPPVLIELTQQYVTIAESELPEDLPSKSKPKSSHKSICTIL
ncbi:MAG: hypothetical protein QM752_05805 [Gammaproteobacteria bacterium]